MEFLPPALIALAALPQFIVYAVSPSISRPGKTDKFPIDYQSGKKINHLDPANWLDASTALRCASHQSHYGVGFVFTAQDPFFFLDIDDCLEATNDWSPLALSLLTVLQGAAVEISNSGKGLHIIGMGICPPHGCKNRSLNLELYTEGRFVALTGVHAMGSAATDCSAVLSQIVAEYFPPTANAVNGEKDWTETPCDIWNGPEDDAQLIEIALHSRSSARAIFGNGATFKDLWEANVEALAARYPDTFRDRKYDESSADMALALHLAYWTGNNCERMLRLMWQSGLVRDKWERDKYLILTITNACAQTKKFFNGKKPQEPVDSSPHTTRGTLIDGSTFLTPEQQVEYFSGCIYICDVHKILIPGGILLKPDQFKAMYGGRNFLMDVNNQRITRNAWEAFTESQAVQHPRAISSWFLPKEEPAATINFEGQLIANTWWPIPIQRKQGDAVLFHKHLDLVLPDKRDQTILLSYMAACVQYKGTKFQWAPLLQGAEGNGKTFFSKCVARALGFRYSHFPKANEIFAKFNKWMYHSLFIGVEDIYVPEHQREVMEILKPMITGDVYEIEPKGLDKVTVPVCCNFILNSNYKEGLRKLRNDRRFAPFYTAQQSVDDITRCGMTEDYFKKLYDWFKDDGHAIISEILHTFQIPDEFNPATYCQRAPDTSSTISAIEHGMGGIEQEILEAVAQDAVGFRDGWISSMFLEKLFEQKRCNRRVPHNKRRELLQSLGYDWHPALTNGRVNNNVMPDNGKPRLFIKHGHPILAIVSPAEISQHYTVAQTKDY